MMVQKYNGTKDEKFYYGLEWMQYLIDDILAPRGYICNGEIEAYGDDYDDVWKLVVTDNVVKRLEGVMTFVEETEDLKNANYNRY